MQSTVVRTPSSTTPINQINSITQQKIVETPVRGNITRSHGGYGTVPLPRSNRWGESDFVEHKTSDNSIIYAIYILQRFHCKVLQIIYLSLHIAISTELSSRALVCARMCTSRPGLQSQSIRAVSLYPLSSSTLVSVILYQANYIHRMASSDRIADGVRSLR